MEIIWEIPTGITIRLRSPYTNEDAIAYYTNSRGSVVKYGSSVIMFDDGVKSSYGNSFSPVTDWQFGVFYTSSWGVCYGNNYDTALDDFTNHVAHYSYGRVPLSVPQLRQRWRWCASCGMGWQRLRAIGITIIPTEINYFLQSPLII